MARIAPALLFVSALASCDSRAKASAEQKSKEYESCAASMQCQDDLHCFEHTCKRVARSNVGDYFAALGAMLRGKGDLEGSVDAYKQALGHYDSEKIVLPPDVDCAYGTALAAARAHKDHAELGARVLHRCILAVPVGSALRDRALADLATLADSGLDPLALNRTALADVYLTRSPATPETDKLAIDVKATPPPTGKTYQAIPDKLAEPELRSALIACWQTYNAASHKDTLAVSIGVKSTYIPSEYDDESGVFTMKIDPAVAMPAGPDATADQCVRAAVEPALKDLKAVRDAFATKLTITIK